MKKMLALCAMVLVSSGCLTGENEHAFYLAPDGSATWTVIGQEAWSDTPELAIRQQGIAQGLEELEPTWIETKVLRAERPYRVVTQAGFESAARMLERFLDEIGLEAWAELEVERDWTRLAFRFDESDDFEDDTAAMKLVEEPASYRFVLTEGAYAASNGFEVDKSGKVAVMLDPDEFDGVYSLTWTVAERR